MDRVFTAGGGDDGIAVGVVDFEGVKIVYVALVYFDKALFAPSVVGKCSFIGHKLRFAA